MKFTIQKSNRYKGYQIGINTADESIVVENAEGKRVARLVADDFLDRLGATAHGFKRQYPRLGLGIHIKYADAEGRSSEGIASTIGGGGIFIEQMNPLSEDSETNVEFSLPASQNIIAAKGKVVWTRKSFLQRLSYPGMGINFTTISEKDRAELIHFVNKFNEQRGLGEF
jgi:CubicO group peptidase (beta-lactamase class C family)